MDEKKKPRVLVVEDEENLRLSISFTLRRRGYDITAVPDAGSAFQQFEMAKEASAQFDLLITDIQLPGMSGLQMIRELRRRLISIPVLVVTAHGSAAVRRELDELGADLILDKPFDSADLIQAAASRLGHRR